MEPLGKMNAYFPIINEHISKRNKKVGLFAIHVRYVADSDVRKDARLRCGEE